MGFSLSNNSFSITYFFLIRERYVIVLLLIQSHAQFVSTSASLQKYPARLHAESASFPPFLYCETQISKTK
jgi:hypothetical protein